jgi:hypothetical protein
VWSVWSGFTCFRTGASGWLLFAWQWTFWIHKTWGISWVNISFSENSLFREVRQLVWRVPGPVCVLCCTHAFGRVHLRTQFLRSYCNYGSSSWPHKRCIISIFAVIKFPLFMYCWRQLWNNAQLPTTPQGPAFVLSSDHTIAPPTPRDTGSRLLTSARLLFTFSIYRLI